MDGVLCQRGGTDGLAVWVERLTVRPGEAVAITGPSGCGKSTLLDLVGLVLRPHRRRQFALADCADIGALWKQGRQSQLARLRAQTIGYVLQTGGLLPFLTVRDNIRLSRSVLGLGADPQTEGHLINALGLSALLRKKPAALSIGERQRVAIARALAHRPPLVLADEPTASLDPGHAAAVMGLFLDLVRDFGLGLLMVSHDWDLLDRFPLRRVAVQLSQGRREPNADAGPQTIAVISEQPTKPVQASAKTEAPQ
jgi:putative ABC transport system ATP-binding protein